MYAVILGALIVVAFMTSRAYKREIALRFASLCRRVADWIDPPLPADEPPVLEEEDHLPDPDTRAEVGTQTPAPPPPPPPQIETIEVEVMPEEIYVTQYGVRYHCHQNCFGLRNANSISTRTPCQVAGCCGN